MKVRRVAMAMVAFGILAAGTASAHQSEGETVSLEDVKLLDETVAPANENASRWWSWERRERHHGWERHHGHHGWERHHGHHGWERRGN